MQVMLNGKPTDVNAATAGQLLHEIAIARERIALVINEQVVRRADLDNTALHPDDVIEIITMVGGG